MQFHSYELLREAAVYRLQLKERISTDGQGVAACLGLQVSPKVELKAVLEQIEAKLPHSTLLTVGGAVPVPKTLDLEADED
jgi:hypothetical protein